MTLPPPPRLTVAVLDDLSPPQPAGFLRLVRRRLALVGEGGAPGTPFVYDEVDRRALDAVVVAAHFRDAAGTVRVLLRSVLRPPAALRDPARSPIAEPEPRGCFWELPAGLVEPGEQSPEGLRQASARELLEETGFDCPAAAFAPLGPSTFPTPGVVAERHFFFRVEVDPARRGAPTLDGSVLEQHGEVIDVPLTAALAALAEGAFPDAKTELGLRRLAAHLGVA